MNSDYVYDNKGQYSFHYNRVVQILNVQCHLCNVIDCWGRRAVLIIILLWWSLGEEGTIRWCTCEERSSAAISSKTTEYAQE